MKKISSKIVSFALGGVIGCELYARSIGKILKKELKNTEEVIDKMTEFYDLLIQWVEVKQRGCSISEYLHERQFDRIAIYGIKEIGELLLKELEGSEVEVAYVIDRDADSLFLPIHVCRPDDSLKSVDAIVVTCIHYFDEIKKTMESKMNCPVLSIEDIVFQMWTE